MKRIPAFLLLTILLINVTGFYFYYIIELQRIHTAMRARIKTLPDEQLTRLSFTKQSFDEAYVEEGEVKVNNKMFDIARVKIDRDSIIVFALHDEMEDDLIALVDEIIAKPLKPNSDVANAVVSYINLIFIPSLTAFKFNCDSRLLIHQSLLSHLSPRFFVLDLFRPPRIFLRS